MLNKRINFIIKYLFKLLFDYRGKIDRLEYFVGSVLTILLLFWMALLYALVVDFLIECCSDHFFHKIVEIILILFFVVIVSIFYYMQSVLNVKRLRDIWKDPWLAVLYFFSLIGIFFQLYLLFASSKEKRKKEKIE